VTAVFRTFVAKRSQFLQVMRPADAKNAELSY